MLCDLPTCFDNQNKCFRACDCLRRLTIDGRVLLVQNSKACFVLKREDRISQMEKVMSVAEGGRKSKEKSESTKRKRVLAQYDLVGNGSADFLCNSTVKNLLGIGKWAWKRMMKGALLILGQ